MKAAYLITGGTGLVGQRIIQKLVARGERVHILTRRPASSSISGVTFYRWNPDEGTMDAEALKDVHTVIHLAGAPVAQRWTPSSKRAILDSRTKTSALLHSHIAQLNEKDRPEVCIGASAIGIYPSGKEELTETSPAATGFLSDVVQQWESGVETFESMGLRTVRLRIGLVLAEDGGMLGKLLPIFRLGLGSAIGSGKQWQSWIHIEDLADMFLWAAEEKTVSGIFNAVAPHPVTNYALSKSLARACKRPFWAPAVPAWALRLVFGEMASVVLASQKVRAERVVAAGFAFSHPALDDALRDILH